MSEKIDKELEKKVEEIVEKKTKKNNNNIIIILVMLLVFVSVAFLGYVLMDKGIIFSDNNKDNKLEENEVVEEKIDFDDSRFYKIHQRLQLDIKEKSRPDGYKSFDNVELFSIGITELGQTDFTAAGKKDETFGFELYTFSAKLVEEKLVKYFGNDVTYDRKAILNNSYLTNVNFDGNLMNISSYDEKNDIYACTFAGTGFVSGPSAKIVDRKIVDAKIKDNVITVTEKVFYSMVDSDGDVKTTYILYSDPELKNEIGRVTYDNETIEDKVVSIDSYEEKAATITSVYKYNEKTDSYYFVNSSIK